MEPGSGGSGQESVQRDLEFVGRTRMIIGKSIMKPAYKLFHLLVTVVFLFSLLGFATMPAQAGPAKAHPLLVQLADDNPQQSVAVIVQKADNSGQVEARVHLLGGEVTKDLQIINAFVAEMSASAALELARDARVRWVSLDAPVITTGDTSAPIDITNLQAAFIQTVGADRVWNEGPAYLQGQGVTVAIIDSGDCSGCRDLLDEKNHTRTLAAVTVLTGPSGNKPTDFYGHGSLIEGIVGNNGTGLNYKYMGVAPSVNLVSVKIADNLGKALSSDVVAGLQWVLNNKSIYNIRVATLSLNSTTLESHNTNPINAAVEILWFNGIVVVVSAGNNGSAALYPPANDPFVITIGATDDKGTADLSDDTMAPFSAYGTTESKIDKPDLVAPGTNIISIVPTTKNKIWKDHASNRTGESTSNEYYMRVSGTSFAGPIVAGASALLLQDEPNLTPDQVKFRLMATANKNWPGYDRTKAGAGYLDIYAAVHGTTMESANTGIDVSQLLWTGSEPITWGSVSWNSVSWNSVSWNSVSWNSVSWNSVSWNSDYWGP